MVSLRWVDDGTDRQCLGKKAMALRYEVEGVSKDGAMACIVCSGKRGVKSLTIFCSRLGRINSLYKRVAMLILTPAFPTSERDRRMRKS